MRCCWNWNEFPCWNRYSRILGMCVKQISENAHCKLNTATKSSSDFRMMIMMMKQQVNTFVYWIGQEIMMRTFSKRDTKSKNKKGFYWQLMMLSWMNCEKLNWAKSLDKYKHKDRRQPDKSIKSLEGWKVGVYVAMCVENKKERFCIFYMRFLNLFIIWLTCVCALLNMIIINGLIMISFFSTNKQNKRSE